MTTTWLSPLSRHFTLAAYSTGSPASDAIASEGLPYGGYKLTLDDKDSVKGWGGATREDNAAYVKELQEDLVELGYWVSTPEDGNGRNCDGIFGGKVKAAVVLFQRENNLEQTGDVDTDTANLIKQYVADSYERPGHVAGEYGTFYQLKPLNEYHHYNATYDADGIMDDNWGKKDQMDFVYALITSWNDAGYDSLLIGDISKYLGGDMPSHDSHKDGKSIDIDSNRYCSINKAEFNKEDSLELIEQAVAAGAKRIIINCKYVTDNNGSARAMSDHHNHIHVDVADGLNLTSSADHECKKCKKSVYDACDYASKVVLSDSDLTP